MVDVLSFLLMNALFFLGITAGITLLFVPFFKKLERSKHEARQHHEECLDS